MDWPRAIYDPNSGTWSVVATMKDNEVWDMKLVAWGGAAGRITSVDVTDCRLRAWRGQAGQIVSADEGERKA